MAQKEEIIFEFQIEQGGAIAELEKTKKAIIGLKEEQKDLNKAYKEQNITYDEYISETVRVEQVLKKQTKTYGELTHQVQGTKSWTDQLKGSMQQLAPGLSGAVSGLQGMTKAAIAFIATPLGAIIAAIGAAIYAVTQYLRGSEEGQNKWNKVVQVGSAIFERFMDIVEDFGALVVSAFENPKQAIKDFANLIKENIINRFEGMIELIPAIGKSIKLLFAGEIVEAGKVAFDAVAKIGTGIENVSGKIGNLMSDISDRVQQGVAQGQKIADLQKAIRDQENALAKESARVNLEVAKLREKAVKEEGETKKKTIEEAIALEQALADKTVALARQRLELAIVERDTNGATIEANKAVNDAEVALLNAQAQRYEATLRFQKEYERLSDAEIARIAKEQAAKDKAKEQEEDRQRQVIQKRFELDSEYQAIKQELEDEEIERLKIKDEEDLELYTEKVNAQYASLQEQLANETALRIQTEQLTNDEIDTILAISAAKRDKLNQEKNDKIVLAGKKMVKIHELQEKEKLAVTSESLGAAASLFKEHTIAYKVLASAKAIIDTYAAAAAALDDYPTPLNFIMMAANIVAGLGTVAKINGVALAGGGRFTTKGPTWLLVGDNPGGREEVSVRPISGKGTSRILGNGAGVALAGGGSINGSIMASSSTAPIDTQFAIADTIANLPPVNLVYSEYQQFTNKVSYKEELTTA